MSLRRTASLFSQWPSGLEGPVVIRGRARDLFTGEDVAAPIVRAEDSLQLRLSSERLIETMEASRRSPDLARFVGLHPGGPLRKAMAESLSDEVASSTLLHRLLDDLAAVSFVTTHAWAAWLPDWVERFRAAGLASRIDRDVTGVCYGFRPGSSVLADGGRGRIEGQSRVPAPPPLRADDSHAWHRLETATGPNQMRTRRVDIWLDDGLLRVDSSFQDSAAQPETADTRLVFHEYQIAAVVEPRTFTLMEIKVTPTVLPYGECVGAASSAQRMVGASLRDFRRMVPATLPGAAGCTHLNDMMRALQDVVPMAETLDTQAPRRRTSDLWSAH